MAQSAVTVTPGNPTPPTKLSFVGSRPPTDPAQAVVDDGIPYFLSGGVLTNFMSLNETSSSEANSLRVVFAAKTAAAGSGTSVDHEGKGNETLFTQTYNTPTIYAPVVLQTDGCGPALTQGTMPNPNQLHASTLSPATNPTLASISPTTAVHGASGTDTITATGTGFNSQSVMYVAGVRVPTTFVSATSLTAAVPKQLNAGAVTVTVITGGVVTTAGQTLTYT